MKLLLLIGMAMTLSANGALAADIEKEARYKSATMACDGKTLTIGTGKVIREWSWTGKGWKTSNIAHMESGKVWPLAETSRTADWQVPGVAGEAELISVTARESDDEGFTSRHLEVVSTVLYPTSGMSVQHVVWAYPDAPGLRTQLRLKRTDPALNAPSKSQAIGESLPLAMDGVGLQAMGYYSDTQNRNCPETEILKEEKLAGASGAIDWASIIVATQGRDGLVLVKESHKCVNTPAGGANTGGFAWGNEGLSVSGLGWDSKDIDGDRYYSCWANWMILSHGNEDDMALDLKIWDRIRYPIDPARDIYIMANTWGSTTFKRDAQIQAREDNILAEIASQADLGIDVQQIDDGWQGFGYDHWRPVKENTLEPNDAVYGIYKSDTYPVYPEGWKNVREFAKSKGVTLGLWAANNISADDLIWNYENGDFRYYKIDFAHLTNMASYESLMGRARELILHSGHKVRINWDVTERSPRVGYFSGREYGNIYLENRKPIHPAGVVYHPYLVLRDAWQVSKFLNLNKFQVTVQNNDRVNQEVSDAYKHPHGYTVAQTLMGSPIFFQETHYYTEEARQQIRPLLKVYKQHRNEMYKGYVFPIGDKPDNKSWSGFQCHIPNQTTGYLTLFRQIGNTEPTQSIALKFLEDGTRIKLTDLVDGAQRDVTVGADGEVDFPISKAAGFKFMKYEALP